MPLSLGSVQGSPEKTRLSERLRLSGGTQFLMMAWIVGKATPSPRPIRARTSTSGGSQRIAAATGVSSVKSDQVMTPQLSMVLGETAPLAR